VADGDRQLIDLGFMLMDRQLIDSKGRRCGKVDDLDLEGGPGEETKVVAIVSGPEAWRAGKHGPIGLLAARLFGGSDDTALVHLDTIEELGPVIKLKLPASELGLGQGDERVAQFIRRIPGA
jgi:sporulation protein YlmC with PRC-barrel domain